MSEPEMDLPSSPQESPSLQDTAISWYVRVRNPELRRDEQRAFLRWLSADERHRHAFTEIEQLWGRLEMPARLLGGNGWYRARSKNRWLAWGSAAACLFMMLAASWHNPGALQRMQADYATRPGEQLQVALADGSQVFLDGDSALSFEEVGGERLATLIRGRAWFEVKRDEQHPFIARQGDFDVRVLGTSFSVDTHGKTRTVAVESGQVRVFWQQQPLVEKILTAGDQLRFLPDETALLDTSDTATLSAWRRGLFVFDQSPLVDVTRTMESILDRRIILSPGIAGMKITGVFQSSNPTAMIDGLVLSSGLKLMDIPLVGLYLYQ